MLRREFIKSLGLGAAGLGWPLPLREQAVAGELPSDLPALPFQSALQAAEAIRRKVVSSVELTRLMFERIKRHDVALHAFAYLLEESALVEAAEADRSLAKGVLLGPFHGIPVHVKESFAVAGQPCTWGLEAFRESKAAADADVVERLRQSGVVLIGATNIAEGLSDWQSHNPIYGTTNNPWNAKCTAGGSSGGSAAALAAGLGYLSIGSDLAGSIRTPAHFCGVYGHKPTLDLVSGIGHSPGGVREDPGDSSLLAVCGPMARDAADLRALIQVLGGPSGDIAKAWKWALPPARHQRLSGFRVGYVLDDPFAPITPESRAVLEAVIEALGRNAVLLKKGWPLGLSPTALLENYLFMLGAFLLSVAPPEEQSAAQSQSPDDHEKQPGMKSFVEWKQQDLARLKFRATWQSYFRDIDVFLMPVAVTEAFPHDHRKWEERTLPLTGKQRPYEDLLNWACLASLTGCPATAAPAGFTEEGLPVGIQIMGPYCEDATPIAFAELLENELRAFKSPVTYVQ